MPPSWVWHPKSLQWRIWAEAEGMWVLRDGTRVAPSQSSESEGDEDTGQQAGAESEEEDVATVIAGPSKHSPRNRLSRPRHDSSVAGLIDRAGALTLDYKPPVQIIRSDPEEDEYWKKFADPVLLVQGARSFTKVSAGSSERLDPRFKPRHPDFFSRGRVFKVLWPEPRGDLNSRITIVSGTFGEEIAIKIRWFVVIRANKGYCSCLPVQTYGGRGVGKSSVVKSDHAIIYTGSKEPKPMTDPRGRGEKLDPMSRINFNKIYTIEHNVKVYDFGEIHRDSQRTLQKHFYACWGIDDEAARKGKALANYIAQQEVAQVEAANAAARAGGTGSDSDDNADDDDDDDDDDRDPHWEASAVNQLVTHCVLTWRNSSNPEDHERADYLASASHEEQKEYLRMMHVYPDTPRQSGHVQASSNKKRGRRRQGS